MDKKIRDIAANLSYRAELIRRRTLEIIRCAGGGHTGGDLSAVDLLATLYLHVLNVTPANPSDPNRDRFVMSKGHCVEALYCTLAQAGFIPDSLLNSYGAFGSVLAGHPTKKVPGVEVNSGSLGHGLSVGVGMSIAAKMNGQTYLTYVLMGDGEQGEGSIYEAAMAAGHYKLDNLIAIIDRNGLQISGRTEDIMSLEPIRARWEAFGWEVTEVNGNDVPALVETFAAMTQSKGKPRLLIAKTVKGKGVSFMENVAKWHHGVPNDDQLEQAKSEIDRRIASLKAQLLNC
ncbi:MAG: transketolase [Prevotellaceae bacterium]|jgi:transketolase|nr:transketolase [Prevotellaceae bacterium]